MYIITLIFLDTRIAYDQMQQDLGHIEVQARKCWLDNYFEMQSDANNRGLIPIPAEITMKTSVQKVDGSGSESGGAGVGLWWT
eukprot:g29729.t1